MALDINGYNATFDAFVKFAEDRVAAGKEKAVARFDTDAAKELGRIVNRTIKPGFGDWVGIGAGRLASLKKANNITRDAFMKAVADMFGGESKIPDSVKDAMKLEDYGKGKPLTARRILAVKAAIDTFKLGFFQSADTERIALNMGFVKSEFPKLARAAHFYAQANGLSELDALTAVAEPNSKPNRLMQYGGRFLDNAENFANGLRLMDSFTNWFTAVRETARADSEVRTFDNARTLTDLNFRSSLATHDATAGFERFVFEELAVNGAHDLSGTDPEKLFGMKDNAAMRFFGANRHGNFTGVLASVPPEKRGAIFAVFDKLSKPLVVTKDAAREFHEMTSAQRGVRDPNLVISRILRHLPEIESLAAKGRLTEANIVKTLFPDMPSRNWTIDGLNHFTHNVDDIAKAKMRVLSQNKGKPLDEDKIDELGGKIQLVMEETCCTIDEAVEAAMTGKRVAPPKYMTAATYGIHEMDGTTSAARNQLDGDGGGDFFRAYDYGAADDPTNKDKFIIKDKDSLAFGFTFPNGTSLKANAGVHRGNVPAILDKLESLAGRVHPRQQAALLFAVSQAGVSALKGGLEAYGIYSSEHAAVNFSLSKDAATGAITVKYESPEALPVYFSWTATIDVDGNVTSTPLKVVDKASVAARETGANGLQGAQDELAPKEANKELYDAFVTGMEISASGMPREFAQELRSMLNEINTRFFGAPLAKTPHTNEFIGQGMKGTLKELIKTADAEGRRVTVDEVFTALKPIYERGATMRCLEAVLSDIAKEVGLNGPAVNPHTIARLNPEVIDDLVKGSSSDDIRSRIAKHRDTLKSSVLLIADLRKADNEFISNVENAIAKGLGMSNVKFGGIRKPPFAYKIKDMADAILKGEYEPAKQPGYDFKADVGKLVDNIAQGFIDACKRVDKLATDGEIPPGIAKMWKESLIASGNAKDFSPEIVVEVAKELNPQVLIDGFNAKNNTRAALESIGVFAKKIDEIGPKAYGSKRAWMKLGVDARNTMKQHIMELLFEKTPGLKEAIFSRREEMKANFAEMLTTWKAHAMGGVESVQGPDYDMANILFGSNYYDYLNVKAENV